jgi:hypothetical protein
MTGESAYPEILLKDGVKYVETPYAGEAELEAICLDHADEIFGPATLVFSKARLRSKSGIGSIPDAFVRDLTTSRWFLVEVELTAHPLYDHIVKQVSRFGAGLSNPGTLHALKDAFYEEIKSDPDKEALFKKKGITEVFKTVSDILEGKPAVKIIMDGESEEQVEVLRALPFEASATVLRTYCRDGNVPADHIHRFAPIGAVLTVPPAALRAKDVGRPAAAPAMPSRAAEAPARYTGVVHWLTPVKSDDEMTAEECVKLLVGQDRIYAWGERTPGRKRLKPGDLMCFYATGKGVIGHARVASAPERLRHPSVRHPDEYPWVFRVDSVSLYLDSPVVVDAGLRGRLDAFKNKSPSAHWAWFVQATHPVSAADFRVLTKQQP